MPYSYFIGLTVAVIWLAPVAAAQQTRTEAEIARAEALCADAKVAAAFRRDTYDDEVGMRISQAVRCPTAGPQLLANRWLRPIGDTLLVLDLAHISQAVIDRRLAQALMDVVESPSRSTFERIRALQALATQIEPLFVARLGNVIQLAPNAGVDSRTLDKFGVQENPSPRLHGAQPVDEALRVQLRRRLTQLRDARPTEDISIAIRDVLRAM